MVKNPGYNSLQDFIPVVGIATFANGLALAGGTPAKTFSEYIQWVRDKGNGRGTIGVPAPASIPEFLVKVIAKKYNMDIQSAPYRGGAPLMADMLGNQVPAGLAGLNDFLENIHAGKVVTHQQRLVVGHQLGAQAEHEQQQKNQQAAKAQTVLAKAKPGATPGRERGGVGAHQSNFTRGSTHT